MAKREKKKEEDSPSEDEAAFSESEGERLDFSSASSLEDDEGEEEAIETDEEETTTKRRLARKQIVPTKKIKRSRFVEMEASVGDSEDEDEDEEEELDQIEEDYSDEEEEEEEGFVDNQIEEREKEFSAAFERRLAAHAARREASRQAFEEELDPEKVEERLRQLYGRTRHTSKGAEATEATLATVLQPQASDPKLWLVKCRPGKERAAVASLMRGLGIIGNNLGVFSVIGRDSLKGFIYVEAHKSNDVMNAVQKTKLNHLIFASPMNRPVMVPLSEMADVLSAGLSGASTSNRNAIDAGALKIGGWVRVKRGKYSGDLAQIVEVDEDNTGESTDYIVRVKLVPRLSSHRNVGGGAGGKKDRPSARLFDPQEAAQYGPVTKARGYWLYNSEAYKDGYLFKDVRASSLSLNNVDPQPDELERFGALSIGNEESDEKGSETMLIKFTKGEAVVVTRGEFQHLTGIIDAQPEGDQVLVKFDDTTAFTEPLLVSTKHLVRRLKVGGMVRVAFGEHLGKSGMIVSIAGKNAIIFSAIDNQQMTVPVSHLTISTETDAASLTPSVRSKKEEDYSSLELNDLVTIENSLEGEAGIVIRLMNEEKHASVLDINGQVCRVAFKNLRKIPKPNVTPQARFDPSLFKASDRVQFNDAGGVESRPATVLHIYRNNVFLRAIDTGDIIVRPMAVISRPAAFSNSTTPSGHQERSQARPPPPMRHIIGKSVTISGAGPYKGYVGIVKDLTETMARVELHTDCRVVTVSRDRIALPGAAPEAKSTGSGRASSAWGTGGKTPAWTDSRTPAWGGSSSAKTPAWGGNSSAKTPAWGSSSAKTPAWGGGGSSSSKTPAWGGSSSSKTPAWGSTSTKTPAWGGGGISSRTPALADGGKTPSWQSTSRAPNHSSTASTLSPWMIPDAEVSLRTGGTSARITSVLPSGLVQLYGHGEPINPSDLTPVVPGKKDSVRLLNDDQATGTVIGLDGPDAVIRVDGTADFRIVPINSLVKIIR